MTKWNACSSHDTLVFTWANKLPIRALKVTLLAAAGSGLDQGPHDSKINVLKQVLDLHAFYKSQSVTGK